MLCQKALSGATSWTSGEEESEPLEAMDKRSLPSGVMKQDCQVRAVSFVPFHAYKGRKRHF